MSLPRTQQIGPRALLRRIEALRQHRNQLLNRLDWYATHQHLCAPYALGRRTKFTYTGGKTA